MGGKMFYYSLIMCGFFFIISMIFFIFKEKSCILIAGYNFKSKDERKQYDENRISKDYGFTFLKYSLIFLIGTIGCILISEWCFFVSLLIWILCFFKSCGSVDKVFDNYKIY